MGKNLGGKTAFIIAVLVIFLFGIFGIPFGKYKQPLSDRIHLGLDLRGGTHLVLQVHVDEAINAATDRDVQRLNVALAATGATAAKLDPTHPDVITVQNIAADKSSAVNDIVKGTDYSAYEVTSVGNGLTLALTPTAKRDMQTQTIDTSIETIRERIDQLGTFDPTIEHYGVGENEILLELPGVSDPAEVRRLIEATPKLSIHEVVGTPYPDEAQAITGLGGSVPPDDVLAKGSATGGGNDQVWVLKRGAIVEGTDFRSAQPSRDENGRPDITFNLTTDAGERFYKFTDANKGTGQMAITLNDHVLEVATIESAIRDSGRITGGFSEAQAQDLSKKLSSGSIPATISYLETRTVGPSLGAASIHQGVVAALAGLIAVMVFMLIYYRGAGVNADLALLLNLVILLGFMGFSHSTLTLPGIAGVILTIGMGVDSNVLIFERIREELRNGKSSATAVQDGFKHAWITVLDTHITTIVSSGILFLFGTGPVKGFAVTLTFGLLANVFTAFFVSRVIFDYLLSKRDRKAALSI